MSLTAQYLNLLWGMFHAHCTVLSPGAAGMGRRTVYVGNCLDGLGYARQIGGQLLHLGTVIWPGP